MFNKEASYFYFFPLIISYKISLNSAKKPTGGDDNRTQWLLPMKQLSITKQMMQTFWIRETKGLKIRCKSQS